MTRDFTIDQLLELEARMLPGASLERYPWIPEDGGAAVAAWVTAFASVVELFRKVTDRDGDVVDQIDQISQEIRQIKDTLLNIERFLGGFPQLLDRALERSFVNFVSQRLHGLMEMYLELKKGIELGGDITPEIEQQLTSIYHDLRSETRTITGYGVPAGTLVGLAYNVEDDCAALLNVGATFRKSALETIDSFFTQVLQGADGRSGYHSIAVQLSQLVTFRAKLDEYLNTLDHVFSGATASWTSSPPIYVNSSSSGNQICTLYRVTKYNSKIVGNRKIGYSYEETSRDETFTTCVYDDSGGGRGGDRFRTEYNELSYFDGERGFAFRPPSSLPLGHESTRYANSIITKYNEVQSSIAGLEKLQKSYAKIQTGVRNKIASIP